MADAAVDRYILMLRVWHPALTPEEIVALEWIFSCLDEPHLLEPYLPPPTPTVATSLTVGRKGSADGGAGADGSRAERRAAEKAAKKAAKKARAR